MSRSDGLHQRRRHWYFRYKVNGIWLEHATRTSEYQEARRIRTKFLADQEDGNLPNERARWTLKAAVTQWLTDRKHRLAKGSYASEACTTRHLLRILTEDVVLSRLADVQIIHKYESQRLSEEIASKTINNEIMVFIGMLKEAKLWRKIALDYKRLRVIKSDIPDALTREEAKRLLQVAYMSADDAVAPFAAVLAYSTGMRAGEIKGLQIGAIHVDDSAPQLQVKRATTKTNAGCRPVALDAMACWAVRKLLDRAKKLGAGEPEHYLMPTLRSKHTRATDPLKGQGRDLNHPQTGMEWEWNAVRKLAKIEHRRFHDLRHSYITRCAEAGVPLIVCMAQVGHMSAATSSVYTHISHQAIHKAALQLQHQSSDLLQQLCLTSDTNQ
jgi:integrase